MRIRNHAIVRRAFSKAKYVCRCKATLQERCYYITIVYLFYFFRCILLDEIVQLYSVAHMCVCVWLSCVHLSCVHLSCVQSIDRSCCEMWNCMIVNLHRYIFLFWNRNGLYDTFRNELKESKRRGRDGYSCTCSSRDVSHIRSTRNNRQTWQEDTPKWQHISWKLFKLGFRHAFLEFSDTFYEYGMFLVFFFVCFPQ